ncbi:MAG: glycosyltransferase family 39 protein [bacterium]|nr:glycosyltransferase family 39 protein [bacterium]
MLNTTKWLLLLVILTLVPRLYRITNPIADWHSWRQADTASVTREYVKHGVSLREPQYHDLSNIPSGEDNLNGYRMVEFPIINASIATVIRTFPQLSLEITSRLFSIAASVGSMVALFFLVKRISGLSTAVATSIAFALMPFSIYYGRVILPEPFVLLFSTFSLLSFKYWLDAKRWYWLSSSAVALALALLLKPFVVFLAPVYVVLLWQRYGIKALLQWQLIPFAVVAIAPFWWWRNWITQYPAGIPDSAWLFNQNLIRLRPAWFRWLFWERTTKLMLGYLGVVPILANFLSLRKDLWAYAAWGLGILVFYIVIATGNVQHDYYQVLSIPIVSIFLGRGMLALYNCLHIRLRTKKATIITALLIVACWILAWQQVSGFFNVNHWEYVEAGAAVNRLTPADSIVIAPAMGDTVFLYQTNRRGWPIGFEIDDKIRKGATHYVTTSDDDEARELSTKYQTVEKGNRYLLLDLTQPK